MNLAAIGLGGNLGDPRSAMAAALAKLADRADVRIVAVSSLYETPPWGKTDQPAFLNAAARIETEGTARMLLQELLRIEEELGRTRTERWGPRSIDLDILLFGTDVVDEPGLHVPHPRLAERAFALLPLAEVMPEGRIGGRSPAELLAGLDRSGIVRIAGPEWAQGGVSVEALQGRPDGA